MEDLKSNLFSDDWETSLAAADKLSQLKSPEAISLLTKGLKSEDNFVRNASALGIREANSGVGFKALFNRIVELGPNEEIGTLVYALEMADCSGYLQELIELYFNGNFEVKFSVKNILNNQIFLLTSNELISINQYLTSLNVSIEDLEVNYQITNDLE